MDPMMKLVTLPTEIIRSRRIKEMAIRKIRKNSMTAGMLRKYSVALRVLLVIGLNN
jgi:hypothetical protein